MGWVGGGVREGFEALVVAPHIQMGDCGLSARELPQVARLASAHENPEVHGTCNLLL